MDRYTQRQYHHHQPSNTSFFTGYPIIRAGYPNENIGGGRSGIDMYRGRLEMREAILREIEKERIRGEIIAERRRILEIEVRNEMMMERHMAMRSREGRFSSAMMRLSLPPSHSNLFVQRSLNPQPIQLEERIIMSIDEKHSCESRRLQVSPFQPCGDSIKIKEIPTGGPVVPFQRHGDSLEIKEISVHPEDNRKEIIVLGKPNGETLSGTKRKSTSPIVECSSKPRADSSKKKVKEWSCAICQISTTSEQGLNEHLQGKKHKVKEADYIAKKTGANFGLGVTPKKPVVNLLKLALTTANLKKSITKKASSTTDSNDTKRENKKKREIKRDKYPFWCEMCQVGASSEKTMNIHKKGKKHSTHLAELYRNGKVASEAPATGKSSDAKENSEMDKKKAVVVNMVAFEDKTKAETETVTKKASSTTDSNDTKRENKKKREIKRDKYPFWCEMCQVGASSEKTMNIHKKGKKHSTHLAELYRNGKVASKAPATGKSCDAEENSEMDTKKAVVVNMVAFEDKTKAETETKNAVVLEAVTDEKSETEVDKTMVVEVVETVKYGMENVTAEEAETIMDDKENVAEDAHI